MCGRFSLTVDGEALCRYYRVDAGNVIFEPNSNIAPGQYIPVITGGPRKEAFMMRWGLIPRWSREPAKGYRMFNARAETVDRKPAFREPFLKRRCLIPADAFYEWKKAAGRKIPFRIYLPGKRLFSLAGIWDCWVAEDGRRILSCSILTTDSNDYLKDIHDRMPVILADDDYQQTWLEERRITEVKKLLHPYPGEMMAVPYSPESGIMNPARGAFPGQE
jgi:putative SOS response-associated peptidase YedK